MDFQLLADVWQRDGERLGELRHVVYDPAGQQVLELIVQQEGPRGRAVILPASTIAGTEPDGEVTYTDLSPEQFDRLERYAYGENIAPPPADIDPIDNRSADLDEEIVGIPDVAPVGAAEGITSIAFTPVIEVVRNVPEGAVIIDDTTEVQAIDGVIGKVKHVLTSDDTMQVSAFIARRGHIFTHDMEVPMDWVAAVGTDTVTLNVNRETVEASSDED